MATTTADWIEELKSISVLELSERIKALEEEFGVSVNAVAAAANAANGGARRRRRRLRRCRCRGGVDHRGRDHHGAR
jgi:ribosomal protein L7/L12